MGNFLSSNSASGAASPMSPPASPTPPPFSPTPPASADFASASAETFVVLDYSEERTLSEPAFFRLDDGVMGGVSRSTVRYNPEDKCCEFVGEVRTERGGGFASVRTQPWGGWNVGNSKGLALEVKGDGKTYKIAAKQDDAWDSIVYQQDFQPRQSTGDWEIVYLPWEGFKPTFRGGVVPGAPRIEPQRLRQVGFMLSKLTTEGGKTPGFAPGPFLLKVRTLRGFR